MKCALVHDWLTGMRGGEKVLEVLCEIFPEADLHTIIHVPGSVTPAIENRRIVTSVLSRMPGVKRYYRYLLPLMPAAAQRMKLRGYDLVIATSHCVAHGVDVDDNARFVCYCFTPMRYAWEPLSSYYPRGPGLSPSYWLLRALRKSLRRWDRRASEHVTEYIADCRNIQQRIKACYGRESAIIHPPVDTDFYHPLDVPREDFYLWAGALAPYKRIDLAVDAFSKVDRKLVVIGDGQDTSWARRAAPANVQFLGRQPDEVLREHYARCRALIFPGEEDFGIVPLEAQACGCPVIAYGRGGATETVKDMDTFANTPTGVYFQQPEGDSLVEAILMFEDNRHAFRPEALRAHALSFSRARCRAALKEFLLPGVKE